MAPIDPPGPFHCKSAMSRQQPNHSDGEETDSTFRKPSPPPDGEKARNDEQDDTYPEGGLRAWLVAAGAACILFATLGWSNSFGVFLPYYMKYQLSNYSPDSIAWIGSVQVTLTFATGIVGGPLFDRYGTIVSLHTPASTTLAPFNLLMFSFFFFFRLFAQQRLLTSSPS